MNLRVVLLFILSSAVLSHGFIHLCFTLQVYPSEVYIGGLEVPGRSISVLQLFENYALSCTKYDKDITLGLEQLSEVRITICKMFLKSKIKCR